MCNSVILLRLRTLNSSRASLDYGCGRVTHTLGRQLYATLPGSHNSSSSSSSPSPPRLRLLVRRLFFTIRKPNFETENPVFRGRDYFMITSEVQSKFRLLSRFVKPSISSSIVDATTVRPPKGTAVRSSALPSSNCSFLKKVTAFLY